MTNRRPNPDEHAPYYGRYIDLVTETDVVSALEAQGAETLAQLRAIDEAKSRHRYAAGKWSIREVVGHITDAERVFVYRAMAFARGEQQPLPGFDEKDYMQTSGFDEVSMADLVDAYDATRRSSIALLRTLPADAWDRRGIASDNGISVRALAYTMVGHDRHHMRVLRERYL